MFSCNLLKYAVIDFGIARTSLCTNFPTMNAKVMTGTFAVWKEEILHSLSYHSSFYAQMSYDTDDSLKST